MQWRGSGSKLIGNEDPDRKKMCTKAGLYPKVFFTLIIQGKYIMRNSMLTWGGGMYWGKKLSQGKTDKTF